MPEPIPEAFLTLIWQALQRPLPVWRPRRRCLRLQLQPPLLSCQHRGSTDSRSQRMGAVVMASRYD